MLKNHSPAATAAVKDIAAAKKFYGEVLGLEQVDTVGDEVVIYRAGNASLVVYRSEYAGTNQATAVTWDVGDDLEAAVRDLKAKGITFEHYDFPGGTRDGDIHIGGGIKTAWFKDPDGNIHNLASG